MEMIPGLFRRTKRSGSVRHRDSALATVDFTAAGRPSASVRSGPSGPRDQDRSLSQSTHNTSNALNLRDNRTDPSSPPPYSFRGEPRRNDRTPGARPGSYVGERSPASSQTPSFQPDQQLQLSAVDPNPNSTSSIQSTPGTSSRGQQLGDAGRDSKPLPPIGAPQLGPISPVGYEIQPHLLPATGPSSFQTQTNVIGGEFVDRALDKFAEQSREAASLRTVNIQLSKDLDTNSKKYGDLLSRYNSLIDVKNSLQERLDSLTRISEEKLRRRDEEREGLQRELNKVKGAQSSVEKSKRELSDANSRLIDKERDIRQLKSILEVRDRKIKSQQSALDKLQRTVEGHMENIRVLKIELAGVETELERKRVEYRRLEEEDKMKGTCIQEIEKELLDLKSSSENQAHHIRELQEKAFQHVEEGQWMPDTNREVSDQLNGLSKQMQRWCRNFSRRSMLRVDELDEDDKTRLREVLSQVAHTVNGEYVFQLENPVIGSRLPELLLMSALSHDLYKTIFSDPFFFESHSIQNEGQPEVSAGLALAKLWSDLLKGDEKAANHWRSETLRLLDPCAADTKTMRSPSSPRDAARKSAARWFSERFIAGNARVLLDPESRRLEDRTNQLIEIALRAAETSYRLWTRRTRLACFHIEDLGAESALKYSSQSPLLEYHELHNVLMTQNGRALDGNHVAVVTHPAVVAYGDPEGGDYSKRTIWRKAVVWMG